MKVDAGRVWVLWAAAGTRDAEVELPIVRQQVQAAQIDGTEHTLRCASGRLRIRLQGEAKMAPPILLIDPIRLCHASGTTVANSHRLMG